jgi:DNA-binding MarR family transcriptional regulator
MSRTPRFEKAWRVLEIISQQNGITASAIYRKDGVYSYFALSRVLKYMREKGLVRRERIDGRSYQYTITPKGDRVLTAYKAMADALTEAKE